MKPYTVPQSQWNDERVEALTHERLLALMTYDPATGYFWPTAGRFGVRRGRKLGHVEANGYRRIMVDGVRVLAHRLAWFYVTGYWPASDLDHRNLQRDDNRWDNLREATRAQNCANRAAGRGRSGLKGAHWNAARNCWQSYIKVAGRSQFLGRFDTAEEAHAAYVAAAVMVHGDFARAA